MYMCEGEPGNEGRLYKITLANTTFFRGEFKHGRACGFMRLESC